MDTLSFERVVRWLGRYADALREHEARLTKLDSAIGDGDHGANMARGFTAVRAKLDAPAGAAAPAADVGAVFRTTAMTLISTVGGASGPLYGTLFLQAAGPAGGKSALTLGDLFACLDAGVRGVMTRGKAVVGDKTMVDALVPAVAALRPADDDTMAAATTRAAEAARAGADSTVPLVARKGRASYLGERSAGHLDPGAASSVLLFETLAAEVDAGDAG